MIHKQLLTVPRKNHTPRISRHSSEKIRASSKVSTHYRQDPPRKNKDAGIFSVTNPIIFFNFF